MATAADAGNPSGSNKITSGNADSVGNLEKFGASQAAVVLTAVSLFGRFLLKAPQMSRLGLPLPGGVCMWIAAKCDGGAPPRIRSGAELRAQGSIFQGQILSGRATLRTTAHRVHDMKRMFAEHRLMLGRGARPSGRSCRG